MKRIPSSALFLGLAGLLPFLWGAGGIVIPAIADISRSVLAPHFSHRVLLSQYGVTILAFMSGVIWGFATRAEGRTATLGYIAAVLPALWAFVIVFAPLRPSLLGIAAGFIVLLAIDWVFVKKGLAPDWWMPLRLLLTAIVVPCLLIGAL